MTRPAHQPSNQPGWSDGEGVLDDVGANGGRRGFKETEEEGGGGVLPSNTLALMVRTALTFNH